MPNEARFRELDRSATQGPWFTANDPNLHRNEHGDMDWPWHLSGKFPPHWDYYLTPEDADLIVAMRNSLGVLFQAIDAARSLANAWGTESAQRARAELNSALQRLEDV